MADQTVRSKRIRFKNFLSFGNTWTEVDLSQNLLTAVLGENYDTGGENSRNGVGKSTIGDALCYAVFGVTMRPEMTLSQLVNKLARKGQSMVVQYEFDKDDSSYMIERGEKPSLLNLYKKPFGCDDPWDTKDDSGKIEKYNITEKTKDTTNAEIERLWGLDLILTKYVALNSTENDPFPKLDADKRRKLFESLFNLKILSKRAKELSEERKELNKTIIATESALNATIQANLRIQSEIDAINKRTEQWDTQHTQALHDLRSAISRLENVNAEEEIETIKLIQELADNLSNLNQEKYIKQTEARQAETSIKTLSQDSGRIESRLSEIDSAMDALDKSTCPTCFQHWEPDKKFRENLLIEIEELQIALSANVVDKQSLETTLAENRITLSELNAEISELVAIHSDAKQVSLTYKTVEDAASAKTNLEALRKRYSELEHEFNPYTESATNLTQKALQEVNDTDLKDMKLLLEHYKILIDLLTNEDGYLRKAIMNDCLPRLNQRIAHYLSLLELPHKVKILPDMNMRITDYGQEFGWGGLSRGQRQRVVVAMNFAFQDVYEAANHRINTLIVDELIDNGICSRGAQNTVDALKEMVREKDKRILLITHREDIASQIPDRMTVKLKNKLSWIEHNEEESDAVHQERTSRDT